MTLVKDIDINNLTYYLFNDTINVKNFDSNNIEIDEKSYKHIPIYYIAFVTIKDLKYLKTSSVYPLYILFSKVNGYFEEVNGNTYLTLVANMKAKKNLKHMKNCGVKSGI